MKPVESQQLDQLELGYLTGIQDQHALLAENRRRSKIGWHRLMTEKSPSQGGTVGPQIDTEVEAEDVGIRNRSPQTTITNNYGNSALTAILATSLVAIVLIVAIVGAVLWWNRSTLHRPSQPAPIQSSEDYDVKFFD